MTKTEQEVAPINLSFAKPTPAPLPGYFYMEMIPDIPASHHSPALDSSYKHIHMPITQAAPIDVMSEIRECTDKNSESWLIQGAQIDSVYYQEKSDRNELLMRDEQKHAIQDVLDYQKHLVETFDRVNDKTPGIVEEYPLLLAEEEAVVVSGADGKTFSVEDGETTLVGRCTVDGETVYESVKLYVEDKICIEIRDGKAYYMPIKYVYKLSKGK